MIAVGELGSFFADTDRQQGSRLRVVFAGTDYKTRGMWWLGSGSQISQIPHSVTSRTSCSSSATVVVAVRTLQFTD